MLDHMRSLVEYQLRLVQLGRYRVDFRAGFAIGVPLTNLSHDLCGTYRPMLLALAGAAVVVGAVVAAAEDAFAALCVSDAAAEDWAMEVSASRIEDASSGV